MQTGDPSEGIAHWRRAVQIELDDLNTQSNLAWVFCHRAQRRAAQCT